MKSRITVSDMLHTELGSYRDNPFLDFYIARLSQTAAGMCGHGTEITA